MFDLQHSEGKRLELVQRMHDVGKEPHGIQNHAAVDTRHIGLDLGQALWAGGTQKGLRSWYDTREEAEGRCRECLRVFSHRRLADDGEQGDDIETPAREVLAAPWKPSACQ